MTIIHTYTPCNTTAIEKDVDSVKFENSTITVMGNTYPNRSIVYAWHGVKHRIPLEYVVSIEED